MRFTVSCLLVLQASLFAKEESLLLGESVSVYDLCNADEYSFKEAIASRDMMDSSMMDKIRDVYIELGIPISAETKELFYEAWIDWLANRKNRHRLIQKMRDQAEEGGLSDSVEFCNMLQNLEKALDSWDELKVPCVGTASRYTVSKAQLVLCSIAKNEKTEEEKEDIRARIEELRELEQEHKDEAKELFIQFGAEAIGTGVSVATGAEVIAVIEGVQATRHFVAGCREYNDAVGYQEMANKLEEELCSNEGEPVKHWWEFWK